MACIRQSSRCCLSDSFGCLPRNFPCIGLIKPGREGDPPLKVCRIPWETLDLESAYRHFSDWGRQTSKTLGSEDSCCLMCRDQVGLLAELATLGGRWTGELFEFVRARMF